jgi:hypothetical protein
LGDFLDRNPLQAFDENEQALTGQLDDLMNEGHCPDLEEVYRLGVVHAGIALRNHPDELLFILEIADQLQRTVPAHCKRKNGVWKQHRITNGQDWKIIKVNIGLMFRGHGPSTSPSSFRSCAHPETCEFKRRHSTTQATLARFARIAPL